MSECILQSLTAEKTLDETAAICCILDAELVVAVLSAGGARIHRRTPETTGGAVTTFGLQVIYFTRLYNVAAKTPPPDYAVQ